MRKRKFLALAVASLMSVSSISALTSCGTKVIESTADATKATLTVATYDGGVGHEWLEEAAVRFEEKYKDATNFESGKKGVDVVVEYNKDTYQGPQLADKTLDKDVYFTEGVDYFTFVNRGKVADISDVVRGSLSAYGESGTIEDKLDDSFKTYLTAKENKYYMLPFYDGFYGFIYDVDLFEQEGFYFDQDGDFIVRGEGESQAAYDARKSAGPDGKSGTYDDGLPATYDQLLEMVDQIVARGCIPFCYAGNYSDYVSKACRSFIADYEGYDAFKLNYTFSGQDVELVKTINPDGSIVTETMDITVDNAYELQRQAGKYYSLMMQEKLFGSVKYIGNSWNAFDFTEAQKEFVKSKYNTNGVRYAMLVEGVWWENEADKVFSDMETLHNESKENRRFALLPVPKVDSTRLGEQTLFSGNSSFCFVNKDCKNMELAKEFLRFVHTDAEMSKFNAKTSISRALYYDVTAADKATATHFGKNLIEMRSSSKVVYPYSSLQIVIDNSSSFTEQMWYLTATVNGETLNNPFLAFKDEEDPVTAEEFFNGLYTYQKTIWKSLK